MTRSRIIFVLKLIVSLGLLWVVLSRLTWSEVRTALADPRWGWLAAGIAVYGVSALGGAMQWSWILRTAGLATPAPEMRRLYFVGLFFNNFLPANIGGDAYKIVDLGRREGCPARVFCVTLLDRLMGLSGLTAFALVAAAVAVVTGVALPRLALVMVLVLVGLLAIMAILVSRRLGALFIRILAGLRLPTLARQVQIMVAEFGVFRARLPWLGRVFLFGMGVQSLRVAVHVLAAYGLRLDPGPDQVLQLLVLIPLLALLLTLPVTVNGIGLREKGAEGFVAAASGLSAVGAVAMEMVAFFVVVLVSLVGGLLWFQKRGLTGAPGEPRPR